ncbi:hypothetical protein L9F63_006923, partial [Diploptera punctata]
GTGWPFNGASSSHPPVLQTIIQNFPHRNYKSFPSDHSPNRSSSLTSNASTILFVVSASVLMRGLPGNVHYFKCNLLLLSLP